MLYFDGNMKSCIKGFVKKHLIQLFDSLIKLSPKGHPESLYDLKHASRRSLR